MAAASASSGKRGALPKPPTRISEKLQAYQAPARTRPRFDRRSAASAARSTVSRSRAEAEAKEAPTAWASASSAAATEDPSLPRLTELSLKTIASNFEANPKIEGLAPEYALAITSSLPLGIDVGITGPHVNDEHYWKRVSLEYKRWRNCRVEEHGLSWKQLFFERYLQEELENFGVFPGISAEHEHAQVRPPIDSTHPLWRELYPKVGNEADTPPDIAEASPGLAVDRLGRPRRERFCKFGVNCDGVRIARAPNCGWVALERLKEFVVPAVEEYESSFAWAGLSREQAWPSPEDVAGDDDEGGDATHKAISAVAKALEGGGAVASATAAAATTSGADDDGEPEADCDANVLKEFLTPNQVAEFMLTGNWPAKRQPCAMCLRAEQLGRLGYHMESAEDSVFTLRLRQLPSHLDLEIPFSRLPNLCELDLTYGITRVGMKYDRALLGAKITDAMSLAKCVKATQTLTSLVLQANLINDKVLAAIMEGLAHNKTITHLDLSHNEITARGVRLLCKALGPESVMMSIDLSDNQIHSDGGKYIGRMLRRNLSLVDVSLRLNAVDERGARLLLEGARRCQSLTSLNLASNEVCGDGITALAECLRDTESNLIAVDLSNNRINDTDAAVLAEAVRDNASLTACDLRSNEGLTPTSEAVETIKTVTRRNELALRAV